MSIEERATKVAAGWYPDPYERAYRRYWDGERWTPFVWDGIAGTEGRDERAAATTAASAPTGGLGATTAVSETTTAESTPAGRAGEASPGAPACHRDVPGEVVRWITRFGFVRTTDVDPPHLPAGA